MLDRIFRLLLLTPFAFLPAGIAVGDAAEKGSPTKITIDDGGFIRVNGKRRYIYGAYRDPSDELNQFAGLKKARFDMTHAYHFEERFGHGAEAWVDQARRYLRDAGEHGIGVALGLPREVVEQQGDVETARTLVEGVKNEPALWLWYLSDEPGHREEGEKVTSNLKKIYTMIKEVDPNHPVVICGARAEFYELDNADNADILWVNPYVVPDGPWKWLMSEVSNYAKRWPSKSVWAVPQAFDWRVYDRNQVITDDTHRPNAKELRAQVHAGIAAGARSTVFYWSPTRLELSMYDIRKLPSVWKAICDIGDEVKVLEQVLLAPQPNDEQKAAVQFERTVKEAGRTKDEVYHWQRWHEDSLYVGIVNAGYERRMKVTVELPFRFMRVMQYPSGLPVITPNANAELTIDSFEHALIPVQFSAAKENSTEKLEFFMYECDAVVWRFLPVSK